MMKHYDGFDIGAIAIDRSAVADISLYALTRVQETGKCTANDLTVTVLVALARIALTAASDDQLSDDDKFEHLVGAMSENMRAVITQLRAEALGLRRVESQKVN